MDATPSVKTDSEIADGVILNSRWLGSTKEDWEDAKQEILLSIWKYQATDDAHRVRVAKNALCDYQRGMNAGHGRLDCVSLTDFDPGNG